MALRIGSYNIANGREVNHDISVLAKDIIGNNLDVVGLQEVDRFASRSKCLDTVKLLAEQTGLRYTAYTKTVSIPGMPEIYGCDGEYGICVLSRFPIVFHQSIPLFSGDTEQRMICHARIDCNGSVIDFVNTHLAYQPAEIRAFQFKELASFVDQLDYCILTGDFNVHSLEEFDVIKSLRKVMNVWADPITFPDDGTTIDNILYSQKLKLISQGISLQRHSDHRMIFAQFSLE